LIAATGAAGDVEWRLAFAAFRPAPPTGADEHSSNPGANRNQTRTPGDSSVF
jgi:hypothetical protein